MAINNMSIAEMLYNYEEPIEIAPIMKKCAKDFVLKIIETFDNYLEHYEKIGATPIVKVQKHNFFAVDYGFLFYVFLNLLKDNNADEKKLRLMEEQFTIKNENFIRNGTLFVQILQYLEIALKQKSDFFYTKNLYLNEDKNVYFISNSVGIKGKIVSEYFNKYAIIDFTSNAESFNVKPVAYGNNVEINLKLLRQNKQDVINIISFSGSSGIIRNAIEGSQEN